MKPAGMFTSAFLLGSQLAQATCPPVKSDFFVDVQDLYPESAAWNPSTCQLYLSATYNCSLVIFDPYSNKSDVIPIPGLTNHGDFNYTEYHLAGVDFDPSTGKMYIAAASANAFNTAGTAQVNYTGPNRVLQFDPTTRKFTEDIDLSPAQQAYLKKTGQRTNGFQDLAETADGSVYAIGTFGNSIVKIPQGTGKPQLWYSPDTYNAAYGFGGIFASGNTLILSDKLSGGIVTFDTRASTPHPTTVALQGLPANYKPLSADGLFAPTKYGGTVALWSDDFNGTSVYGSKDVWQSAHFLGLVLNDKPAAKGGLAVATFDIGQDIFALTEFFQFVLPEQPKASFPMFDITEEVDRVVCEGGYGQSRRDHHGAKRWNS